MVPLLQDFFVKNIGILYAYGSSDSRELSRDLFSTGGNRKFVIFEVFRKGVLNIFS